MNLSEAVEALIAEYPVDRAAPASATLLVEIGRDVVSKPAEDAAALFFTRDAAVNAWLDHARRVLRSAKAASIRFDDGPHLDTWHITVMDSKRTHRTAGERYSVTARIAVAAKPDIEAIVADVKPMPKRKAKVA